MAFSNVPASRFQWSDIRSVPALSSVSFSLEDDSPAAPFLFGQCPLEEGRSRSCTLRLTPALCKIELRSLSCDFRGKAYEGLPFHLERIFLTYANEAYQPLSPGTAMSYRNPGYLAEASLFQHPEMLLRPIGQDISATRMALEESLYCYPNPATGAEMGRMPTHLVLEGSLDGQHCYYPIPLPALEARYGSRLRVHSDRDWADYLYLAKDLMTFSGKKLHGQKNHLNRFKKEFPGYRYVPVTPENYRRTMLKLAEAAEIVCPHQPDADETIHFDGADEFFN